MKSNKKRQLIGSLQLILTSTIWGTAFVAQSIGGEHIEPFTFGAIRMLIGSLVLLPLILFMDKKLKLTNSEIDLTWKSPSLWCGGLLCGFLLCIASYMQQLGISLTTVGKAGFITTLYVVIVPLLNIFLGKRTPLKTWISVVIALVGLYFLCIKESLTLSTGDFYILVCAFLFSLHILVIDHFSPKVDCVKLSCIQFFICSVISAIGAVIFETPNLTNIINGWFPIIYTGVMSCGIAYTLQIVGQKNTEPTIACLILSTESVVALISGIIILDQGVTPTELLGCLLVFIAIILAQIPLTKLKLKGNPEHYI